MQHSGAVAIDGSLLLLMGVELNGVSRSANVCF